MPLSDIEELLVHKKIPVTAMRILVLNEILKSEASISLSDLEDRLQDSDRSTLYRTLKTFEKKGLIHSVQENNNTQYLLCHQNCSEEHHHDFHLHFFCVQCKKTICLDEVDFSTIQIPKEYWVKELKFVANGLCPDCQ